MTNAEKLKLDQTMTLKKNVNFETVDLKKQNLCVEMKMLLKLLRTKLC